MEKIYTSLSEIQNDIKSGTVTCKILVQNYLDRIEKNKHLNAFLEVFNEEALDSAAIIDDKIANKTAGKLAGMVIALKDNICYKNHKISGHCLSLEKLNANGPTNFK